MRTFLRIIIFSCCVLQVKCICNFPCEWIGKKFEYEIPNNANGIFYFSAVNKSLATLDITFIPIELGGFSVELICQEIAGSSIIMSWIQDDRVGDKVCMTVNLISPDIFAFIGRNTLQESQGDPDLTDSNAAFCDVCFRATDNNSFQIVARANGATGGEPLDCAGDRQCIKRKDNVCNMLNPVQPCPGNKFQALTRGNGFGRI